jgi:hypothetical protein
VTIQNYATVKILSETAYLEDIFEKVRNLNTSMQELQASTLSQNEKINAFLERKFF